MNIKVINNINDLEKYKITWDNILDKNNNDNPFIEYDFIETWWRYFGENHKLFIICVIDDNKAIAFFPFMITINKLVKEINFIGNPISSYIDIISEKHNKNKVIKITLDYIFNLKEKYIINLHGLTEKCNTFKAIKKYLEDNRFYNTVSSSKSYFIDVNSGFNEYYNSLKKTLKKDFKRKLSKLEKLENIEFKEIDKNKIDEIFIIHDKRWKMKNDTSNFSKGATREFFKEITLNKASSFSVLIDTITLNEKIIAFKYGFICRGKYIYYRGCHDEDFSEYALGKIIMGKVMEKAFNNNFEKLDLGVGYEPYKTYWSNKYININKMIFSNKKFSFFYLLYSLKEKLKVYLKKNYKIVIFKRNTLGKIKYYLSHKFIKSKIQN